MAPTTETEFQEALAELLDGAQANGVDVEGGWDCRIDAPDSVYGIEIFRVEAGG
ncbi:hypothetical protein ACFQE1_07700 [Halobium palmae]|uniref:Amphi-Trp domain-containing protein n=1 Tax=Halobium palmae TaxID=1776492 RepID=A0ABD5RZ91_9EURY